MCIRDSIQTYDQLQKLSSEDRNQYLGLKTGFSALDRITTGLNKSDLILIAARPATVSYTHLPYSIRFLYGRNPLRFWSLPYGGGKSLPVICAGRLFADVPRL